MKQQQDHCALLQRFQENWQKLCFYHMLPQALLCTFGILYKTLDIYPSMFQHLPQKLGSADETWANHQAWQTSFHPAS
uniref:Putative ovule protein n=1 Tax=Solanum chacoense TaxID=4108 RepID=A0A0V0GI90_SOLCH